MQRAASAASSLLALYLHPVMIVSMRVLGIETSCDETGLAVYDSEQGLLADDLHSQVDLHADYGGVVPELASRDHIRKIIPLTEKVLADADTSLPDLDGVAYTAGPGLMGALLVGATFGRTLAWALGCQAIEVHHMEAHLLAPLLADEDPPPLPFLALLVSGGHTQLVKVSAYGDYTLLGESVDDAAGEAFDKAAKMMELGYPGGPAIAARATQGEDVYRFPRPMTDRPGLDFSFSGLKTHTLNTVTAAQPLDDQATANICRAFEEAVVDTLFIKCRRAVEQTGIQHLVMAGGVSANRSLRARLDNELNAQVYYAPNRLCTDNGAMIAYAGALRLAAGQSAPLAVNTRPRWPMFELPSF